MILSHILFPTLIAAAVFAVRWPHLKFPLDEDLATYTYIARFRKQGLRWKQDAFLFLYPVWRLQLLDRIYGNPETGPQRVRLFLAAHNALTAVVAYGLVLTLTHNAWAALASGLLAAFFLTSPSLEAESFNTEQCYAPFLLGGLWAALLGPEWAVVAGLAWGLMAIAKLTTAIYIPCFLILLWLLQGAEPGFNAFVASALVLAASTALDAARGYFDPESLRQIKARMLATLRTSRRDAFWPRLKGDLRLIAAETFPLWILGLPALAGMFLEPDGPWFVTLTAVTLFILFAQRAFTRYHYTPLIAVLAVTSGLGLAWLGAMDGWLPKAGIGIWMLAVAFTALRQLPHYTRARDPEIMARYGKFEQLLYLPYLGRVLKRLMKLSGHAGEPLYVWGNFTQLYHYSGSPAADSYVYYAMGPWLDIGLEPVFDSVIGGLTHKRPRYLVQAYPDFDPVLLEEITGLRYRLIKTVLARYPVYRLEAFNPPKQDPLKLTWMEKASLMERLTRGRHMPGLNDADLLRGRELKALTECRKLVNLNPHDRDGRIFLGELCERFGLHRQAGNLFEWVVAHHPKLRQVRLMLARQKTVLGEFEEARFLIKDEIRLFGKSTETAQALGRLEKALGQFRAAIDHLQNAIVDAPERWDLRLEQAECYEQLTEPASARKRYLQVWEGATETAEQGFRAQAGVGLARIGAIVNPASATLGDFVKKAPDNAPLAYAHASALEKEGRLDEARELFRSLTGSLKTDLLKANAWYRLARLSEGDEREQCLMQCVRRNPYHYGAQEMLAAWGVNHVPA
ncbi:MAG: hypothetical protein KC553_03485 [Nitrospina sp.]|nr:hypothetical protein [Nitrospina sp.]